MVLQLSLLGLLMLASCFGPGFLVVRRLRWDPIETFTASVALSLVVLYLLAFAAFLAELPSTANFVISGACLAATVAGARDARRLFRSARLRRCLLAFAGLALWTLGALLLIRHYSGGEHCCDWVEHYQRSLHFVEPRPADFLYIGRYLLPARPPFMNVVTGHFLAQVGSDFALYQVAFSILNVIVFLPCCLLARLVASRGLRSFGLLAAVLAANPMFFMNTTYSWTKALTAAYVVLGVWFYLAGLRRRDPIRVSAAFVSVAAGCLVHYSAAPYGLFLGLHFAFAAWTFPRPLLVLAGAVVPSFALMASWLAASVSQFGLRVTFLSNSTITDSAAMGPTDNIIKVAGNIWDSVRPHLFQGQPDDGPLRLLTDRAVMLYQVNLLFALGSVGSLVVGWLVYRAVGLGKGQLRDGERWWWAIFIPFQIVVGIAVHGERIHSGLAHIGLQPVIYMALVLIATALPSMTSRVRGVLLTGMLLDFCLGVALELYMEHSMDQWAWSPNWDLKAAEGLIFLGDRALAWSAPVTLGLCLGALAGAWLILRASGGSRGIEA